MTSRARTATRPSPSQQQILETLQARLEYTFQNPALLAQALTHRSFSADHYERLEFLGDSVLNLAVANMLYKQLNTLPEGDLSRVRANLVKQETLHQLAVGLGLPDLLRLGEGEMRSGGQKRASILADALEAIIGAVYLDAGFTPAQSQSPHYPHSVPGHLVFLGKYLPILLVDFTNQVRMEGKKVEESLLTACPIRLRPILMTSAKSCALSANATPSVSSAGNRCAAISRAAAIWITVGNVSIVKAWNSAASRHPNR